MDMIIVPRPRILLPVPKHEWREPSVHQPRNFAGHLPQENFWLIKAVLADGHTRWMGKFWDRDDADAFLFAAVSGTLKHEPALWDLPTPCYCPDFGEGATFLIAATVAFTATNASYARPTDWNHHNNTVYCLGGGGSGSYACAYTGSRNCGGAGGEMRVVTNYLMAATSNITVGADVAGASGSTAGTGSGGTNGNTSSVTGTGAVTIMAYGGVKGDFSATSATAAGSSTGSGGVGYKGGDGGTASGIQSASGGGGAGGTTANGGSAPAVTGSSSGNGGTGGATSGGSAGAGKSATTQATANNGGNGTGIAGTYGAGGGGGGARSNGNGGVGGNGGNYGGGGGAGVARTGSFACSGGIGRQGIVVLIYTPGRVGGNIAMMGM